MAGMWNEDAGTYRGLSVLLGMLGHIEALADRVEMLKSDYDTQGATGGRGGRTVGPRRDDRRYQRIRPPISRPAAMPDRYSPWRSGR